MSLPYLLLALFPGSARFLPKPGQWMVTLRGVMGFLLAASAIWLFYVLAAQVTPEDLAFLQLTLLGLCLFVWLSSKAAPASGVRRLWATLAIAAALGGIFLAANAPAAASSHNTVKFIDWVPFDEAQAETLSSQGTLVFVDVTADWCLTCKVIERGVLETEKIANAFRSDSVVAMQADWSQPDPKILAYLNKYGRSSIPFYILYRPGKEPHIFNESLTKKRLLNALAESQAIASTEP
jgi:suppressor for copper-sensitivity B